jgi:hypothetical protein
VFEESQNRHVDEGHGTGRHRRLILHAERDGKPALGVTRETGSTANKQKVGSWTGSKSLLERRKLFDVNYPLAWGKSSVKVDAFVTGKVVLSKDMKQTTVTMLVMDKANPGKLETLAEFTVPTDRNVLRDLGVSFALPREIRSRAIKGKKRGDEIDSDAVEIVGEQQQQNQKDKDTAPKDKDTAPKDKDDAPKDKDTPKDKDDAAKDKDGEKKTKPDTGSSPSDIGGVAVRLLSETEECIIRESATQGDGVKWQVESPAPGKKVAFELTNKTDKQLAVVLRLNGVNVVNMQKLEPEFCGKVILNPGKKAVVRGFIEVPEGTASERGKAKKRDGLDDDPPVPDTKPKMTIRPFAVLVGDEAKTMRAELGDKAGLIEIDVFEKGSTDPEAQVNQRGLPPSKALKARETYKGLKTALLQSSGLKTKMESTTAGVKSRELIVPKPESEREEIRAGITDFPSPAFVSRVAIKVVPREAAP